MKINQLKAGSALSYAKVFLSSAISVVYTPVMLSLLGQSEYGTLNLATSMVSYLGLINFGIGSSYMRFVMQARAAQDKEREYNLNGLYLIIFSIMGAITLIAGSVLVFQAARLFPALTEAEIWKIKIIMAVAVVQMAISLPGGLFQMMSRSYEKFFFVQLIDTVSSVVSPFITLPLLMLGLRSIGLQVVSTVLTAIAILFNAVYALKSLKIKIMFSKIDWAASKSILTFSGFVFINQVVNTVNWSVDKFLLGRYLGTAAVSVYSIGYQFQNYFMTFSTAISNMFTPRVNKLAMEEKVEETNELFIRISRVQFLILGYVLAGFAVAGREFILRWAGADYAQSFTVALLMMAFTIIPLTENIAIEIQRAHNKHKFRSAVYAAIAALNVAISIPLCKLYGPVGCAIGTCIGQVVGNTLIINIYYSKSMNLDIGSYCRQMAKLAAVMLAPTLLFLWLNQYFTVTSYLGVLIKAIAFSSVFIPCLWFFGMNAYEKDLIKKPFQAIWRRLKRLCSR